jgi:hypothetical protein
MITLIVNIIKKAMVLIILLLFVSCGLIPRFIIRDLASDATLEKTELPNLYSNSSIIDYSCFVLNLEIDGREVEFHKFSKDDAVHNIFDQFILKPGIHKIQVIYSSGFIGFRSIGSIDNKIEFDAKPRENYSLSYQDGFFSQVRGDSIVLYFHVQMPVIRRWNSVYSYTVRGSEIVPSINTSYTEFKPNIVEFKTLLSTTKSLNLYTGDLLSSSQTAKLLLESDIRVGNIAGKSGKVTIYYNFEGNTTRGITTGNVYECNFDEYQFLPGHYYLRVWVKTMNAEPALHSINISESAYNKLLQLNAEAGHIYKIKINDKGNPIIEDITKDSR